MHKAENTNAPSLGGWILGGVAGLVAFGVLVVIGRFDLFPAAATGAAVALVVGLILGMPGGGTKRSALGGDVSVKAEATPAPMPQTAPAPSPATVQPAAMMATPAAEVVAAPKPAKPPAASPALKAAAKAPPKPRAAKARVEGPERLAAPRKGGADDLKTIEGIGPAMEKLLNSLGFYHFDQIAGWSDADVAWVDANMKTFKGRILRDRWVAQAKIIVAEGVAAFRDRAKTNNY